MANIIKNLSSMTAALIARTAFAAGAGLSFGNARDLYATFGYNRTPTHRDYLAKYLRQDITQRIINAPVKALWTDAPDLDGGSRFNKRWLEVVDEHDVYSALSQADIFAGLGMYSLLVIGIDDGLALEEPVRPGGANRNITYLQPYLEGSVEISELDNNVHSRRFGLPTMYKVTPGDILTSNSSGLLSKMRQSFKVHYTRVLHLADNTLENQVLGHSRLESIYNTLDDIQKVTGGSAETFWLTSNRGLQVDVDKEMELDAEDADNLSTEIEEYQHGLRRVLRTRGVKVNNLGSDVADPRGVFNTLVALVAANTGIPQRVLIGAEAGQLASQQDRANWAIQVDQRVQHWGKPKVLKPFIRQITYMGVLPEPKGLEIRWPEPFKMNPLERGQTSAQQARSITNVARALETSQKLGIDSLASIEEARQMVAPGNQLLVLNGTAVGTLIPKLSSPVNEPKNDIPDPAAKTTEESVKPKDKAKTKAKAVVTE